MGILNHQPAISAIITLLVVQTSLATQGTVTADKAKSTLGGVTQWKPATPPQSLAALAPNEMPTQALHDADPRLDQVKKNDQSTQQSGNATITKEPGPIAKVFLDFLCFSQNAAQAPTETAAIKTSVRTVQNAEPPPDHTNEGAGYVTITNNPGPLAKIFLDLFGLSQNKVQAPVSVRLEFASNLSRVVPNETLHKEKESDGDLFPSNRQNETSSITEAVFPAIEVDKTNGTSTSDQNGLKETNQGAAPIRSWIWIFGVLSSVAALCVITAVSLRMGTFRGTERQSGDFPSDAACQSNKHQAHQGTTAHYLRDRAVPVNLKTAVPSGLLDDNSHVSSEFHPERIDAVKNPLKDVKVVTEFIAGNGRLTADTTFSHLIVPAYTALGRGVKGGLTRARDCSTRPLPHPPNQPLATTPSSGLQ